VVRDGKFLQLAANVAFAFVFGVLTLLPSANAEIRPDHQHTVVTLLSSDNPGDWQTAEEVVRMRGYRDDYALQMIADRLHQSVSLQNDKRYVNALARFARILGETRQLRFRQLLTECRGRYTNPKITKYIVGALKQMPKAGDVSSYEAGKVDFAALAVEAQLVWEANRAAHVTRPLIAPAVGQTMDSVYAAFGLPDHVKALTIPYTRLGNIKAFYYGFGIVQFDFADSDATELTVSEIMFEANDAAQTYQGPHKAVAHAIISAHDKYLRYLVKGARRIYKDDLALQNVLYSKLMSIVETGNKYGLAAMSDALKTLYKYKAPGYEALLRELIQRGNGSDAGNIAARWLERFQKDPVVPAVVEADEPEEPASDEGAEETAGGS
jgi:hypothetical protein